MMGRTNDEGGTRKKNIFAATVFITVVMAIVLVAFSSTVSAYFIERNSTSTGGTITYNGSFNEEKAEYEPAESILTIYGGEKIKFISSVNGSVQVIVSGPYKKNGKQYSGETLKKYKIEAGEEWDSEGKPTKGYFKVLNSSNNEGGWFEMLKHSITVELVGKKEKVEEGNSFRLRLKENERERGVMKLTIEDNEGYSIMNVNGTDIYEVLVNYTERKFDSDPVDAEGKLVDGIKHDAEGKLVFNTSELDMKEGKYKIILEDSATEVEDDVTIKMEKRYLKVECDEEVIKGEDIVIIIKSSFYEKKVNVTVEGIPEWEEKTLTLDEEGKKKVKISTENVDCGTYKVTVDVSDYDMKENKYVKIKKSGTSLEVPENATVGDIIHIEGTSDFGDFAVFLVDDVFKKEARISDDKFEWDWDTSGELEGYREIEVFILSEQASFSIGDHVSEDWQIKEGVDASASIFLFLPTFSMTVTKNIAKGDDVVISGTAIGTDHIYVIAINYKGEVMFPPGGTASVINAKTTPVKNGEWEENIGELDSGRYTMIALYEGKDEITDAIKNGAWVAGAEGKTLEQRVAILEDAITSAGSDDLFERADFSVHAPKVILKEPKTVVEIGDEITVKAETNIREGEKAFISLFQNSNSNNLKKTFARVENGSVNASINTSGLLPGKYNIAVDISGRASAEKEIILVEKKEVVEEGKEEIAQNESLTEHGTAEKANESIGVGEGEINESYEEEEEERKIPVNVWDLLIAVVVAIFISFAVRGRR